MIVTIGRQYGSGGRRIGRLLAEKLDWGFYDDELLRRAAQRGGIHEDVASRFDERPVHSLLYSAYMQSSVMSSDALPLNQKLAFAQFDLIQELARRQENCVIIGRCADYVLREQPDHISAFIYANKADRLKRLVEEYGCAEQLAEKTLRKQDKIRAEYYNFFTQQRWGETWNYDLSLNSSQFSIDGCVTMLQTAVEQKKQKK